MSPKKQTDGSNGDICQSRGDRKPVFFCPGEGGIKPFFGIDRPYTEDLAVCLAMFWGSDRLGVSKAVLALSEALLGYLWFFNRVQG